MITESQTQETDYFINTEIKEIKKNLIQTILKGLTEYYSALIFEYNLMNDENLIN